MKTEDNQGFTCLSGEITYSGECNNQITITSGNYTLNGEPVELNKAYTINDGDIINDLDFKPPTSDDLKWEFS